MATIIEIIDQLCLEKGIKGSKLCDDIGISRSTLTELRKGRAKTLSIKNANKIADYFNVSVEYLLGTNEQKEIPADKDSEDMDIAVELEEMMQKLESDGSLMFDGNPASPEAIRSIKTALEMGLRYARDIEKGKSK